MGPKTKFYHASTKLNWKPKDIIDCRSLPNTHAGVYMTTSPEVHFTLYYRDKGQCVGEKRYNVYKVLPMGKVIRGWWDDYICIGPVMVLECLGEANKNGVVSAIGRPSWHRKKQ